MGRTELHKIADQLIRLAEGGATPASGRSDRAESQTLALAKAMYFSRRSRERYFPGDLFGEPAWDLLLSLYVSTRQGKRTAIKEACLSAAVPEATALRWLTLLSDTQLVRRDPDPKDGRRTYVSLTDRGELAMTRFLSRTMRLLGAED